MPHFQPFPIHIQLSANTYGERNYIEKQFVQCLEFIRTVYTGKCRKTNTSFLWKEKDYDDAVLAMARKISYGQSKCQLDFSHMAAVHRELSKVFLAEAIEHSAVPEQVSMAV